MNRDEIEAIAQRPTYCKTDGEAVTLSRAERDALVAMARDAERLVWLLRRLPGDALRYVVGVLADTADGTEFRAAIDAAMAQESQ